MEHLSIIRILSRDGVERDSEDKQDQHPADHAVQHENETHWCIRKDWLSGADFYRRSKPLSD